LSGFSNKKPGGSFRAPGVISRRDKIRMPFDQTTQEEIRTNAKIVGMKRESLPMKSMLTCCNSFRIRPGDFFMRFGIPGRKFAVALACLAVAGCAAVAQTLSTPASVVTLTISFPAHVTIIPNNEIIRMPPPIAQLELSNISASPVTLQRPNECQAHVWTVGDASGNTIDDGAICPMIFLPVKLSLAAHGAFKTAQMVSLAYDKYRDGGHYMLHYTFWGFKADAPFTVRVVQEQKSEQ
jgi:hypothetical protein